MQQKFGIINNFAGAVISLNQKKSRYLGIGAIKGQHGQFKVWLTPQKWCVKLPSDLNADDAQQIQNMLNSGILVEGRHYLPVAKKDEAVLNTYLMLLKGKRMLSEDIKEQFRQLVIKKSEGNWSAFEILKSCIKFEEENSRRSDWLRFLKDGLDAYHGPEFLVEDFENDPEAYVVTIDISAQQVVQKEATKETVKAEPVKQTKKGRPSKSDAEKEEALKKYLGDKI